MIRFNVGDLITTDGLYIWVVQNAKDNPESYKIKCVGQDNRLYGHGEQGLEIGWNQQVYNNFIKWTPPEPEANAFVEAAASEPVYVYVAYLGNDRNGVRHTCSHINENAFNRMVNGYELQGHRVLAKKRIKFNL